MKVGEIAGFLSGAIPLSWQEPYDNAGLQAGDPDADISLVLLTVDITEEVVDEAAASGAGMIISHHPLIFSGLKRITGGNNVEKTLMKALSKGVALYSAHTNLDVMPGGISYRMAQKLELESVKPLQPLSGKLSKVVVYIPDQYLEKVKEAMFGAGAGYTGNYDRCSFSVKGSGSFRAGEGSNPFSGSVGSDHTENETRFETIVPDHMLNRVISAMIAAHPYEEVAYDILRLGNEVPGAGLGCVGNLKTGIDEMQFLEKVASLFGAEGVRYSGLRGKQIARVALCGGSGGTLTNAARSADADIFIAGELKYHSFFEGDGKMIVADIGHHESEKCAMEILYEIITKKFPKFAVRFSEIETNPVNYLRTWKKQR